jgi:hypothetical protein
MAATAALALAGGGSAAADEGGSPMKAWMKANMGATKASGDFPALVRAFEQVAGSVPDRAWTEWAPISRRGAAAAKDKDKDAVKEACNACHKLYKDEYKTRFPTRPAP